MGIHTGDSVTVAPAMTLSDKAYQEMRNQAKLMMKKLGNFAGGCNVQFAVSPDEKEEIIAIEINPRVSRSSALASKATDVFRRHPECYDEETYQTFTSQTDPFAAKYIHYVSSVQESQALNHMLGPCVIISASGMCEGGRVLHHLKHAIQDERNIIALVGFQAEHTLGRKLIEEWETVPIFGRPIPRRAKIVRFNGLSAHADRNDLLAYVRAIDPLPSQVFVVHGEERQSFSLASALRDEHPKINIIVPELGSTHHL